MTERSTDGSSQVSDRVDARPSLGPSTRVAYRLADESGQAIEELRPLADSVDPDALDAIFHDRSAADAYVTFRHEGFEVTVTGGGEVLVDPVDGE